MKHKNLKKALTLLLAAALCVSMLPLQVLAENDPAEAETEAKAAVSAEDPAVVSEETEASSEEDGLPAEAAIPETEIIFDSESYNASPKVDILTAKNFPDLDFLAALRELYPEGITAAEAAEVTSLNIWSFNVADFTGLELFPNLITLGINSTELKKLDISNRPTLVNLEIYAYYLEELDLSGCTALENFASNFYRLRKINMENCSSIRQLTLYGSLTEVNFKGCTALEELYFGNNQDNKTEMGCLDLSCCPALREFIMYDGCIHEIIFGQNENLWKIEAHNVCPMQTVDLSGCPNVTNLNMTDCGLTWLDLTGHTALINVNLKQTNAVLRGMDDGITFTVDMNDFMPEYMISKVFFTAGTYDAATGILVVPSGTETVTYTYDLRYDLEPMEVTATLDNEENILNATYFPDSHFREEIRWELGSDFVSRQMVEECKSLNITMFNGVSSTKGLELFTGLESLTINSPREDPAILEELVLPASSKLENLYIDGTVIKNLHVRDVAGLGYLHLDDSTVIDHLYIDNCQSMESIFLYRRLPETVSVSNCHNLKSIILAGEERDERLRSLSISNCAFLESITFYNLGKLTDLNVEKCANVNNIELRDVSLTELDVSNFEFLKRLSLVNTGISVLDLKNNKKLESLLCNNAGLKTLDLSNSVALRTLECTDNELTELDLRNCKNLSSLECSGNRLYRLDLSANTALTSGSAENQRPQFRGVVSGGKTRAFLATVLPQSAFASFIFDTAKNCTFDPVTGSITVPSGVYAEYDYATGNSAIPLMSASAELLPTLTLKYFDAEDMQPEMPEYNSVSGMIHPGNPTVQKDGREFCGWYLDEALTEEAVELSLAEDRTLVLYPDLRCSSYNVVFAPNGGTGAIPAIQGVAYLSEITLPDSGFELPGYALESWNTMPDGSGMTYGCGASVKNLCTEHAAEVVLYAQWTPSVYRVNFDGNGAIGGSMTADVMQCFCGTEYTLPENRFTRLGYVFANWNTAPDGSGDAYADVAAIKDLTYAVNGTVTLYAIWRNEYSVIYDGNGATSGTMVSRTHRVDEVFTLTENAYQKTGAVFLGWALDPDASAPDYANGQSVLNLSGTADSVTLYAVWKSVSTTFAPEGEILYRDSIHLCINEGFYGIDSHGNIAEGPEDTVSYALYLEKSSTARQFDLPIANASAAPVKGQYKLSTSNKKLVTVLESAAGVIRITVKAKVDGACTVNAVLKKDAAITAAIAIYIMDYTPRLDQTSVTVDTYKDAYVAVPLVESYGNEIVSVKLMEYNASTKKYDVISNRFSTEYVGDSELHIRPLCAVANGTVKAALSVECANGITYELPLKVVSKTVFPKITVTQPKDETFRLMYKDSVSRLSVSAGTENILDVSVDEAYNPVFTGIGVGNEAEIRFTPGNETFAPKSSSVKLSLTLEGWNYPVEKVVKLTTNKTKPVLVTDPANGIVRTGLNETYVTFAFRNKTTGEDLELDNGAVTPAASYSFAEITCANGKAVVELIPKTDAKTGKTVYSGGKLKANVQQDNWTSAVSVTFTVTARTAAPTLKLTGTPMLNRLFPEATASAALSFSDSDLYLTEVSAVLTSAPKGTDVTAAADQFTFTCDASAGTVNVGLVSPVNEGEYVFSLTATGIDRLGNSAVSAPAKLKVKVGSALPALKLSESTLTLSRVFISRTAETEVTLPEGYELTALRVESAVSSAEAEKLTFDVSENRITASITNSENIPVGSRYRYAVIAEVSGFGGSAEIRSELTVKIESTLPTVLLDGTSITLNRVFTDADASIQMSVQSEDAFSLTAFRFEPNGAECGKINLYADAETGMITARIDPGNLPKAGTYYCRVTAIITPEGSGLVELKPVALKIIVSNKMPSVLGFETMKLNVDPTVAGKETATLSLSLSDSAYALSSTERPVINFTGTAAQMAEEFKISVEYDFTDHVIKAKLDENDLPKPGRYSFMYAPIVEDPTTGQIVELPVKYFTIQIVNKKVSATVKAVGSVDTVRRSASGITYTLTSLNNCSAEPTGSVTLIGKDAEKFEIAKTSYNEKGQLQTLVQLKAGEAYSTATSYSVALSFEMTLSSGETISVETGTLKIKPVQSSLKLTASPASITYCQSQDRDRTVTYSVDFAVDGIEIDTVTIGSVKFWQSSLVDQAKEIRIEQTATGALIHVTMKDTSRFNTGKYVLPIVISLKGAAENAKAEYKTNLSMKVVR